MHQFIFGKDFNRYEVLLDSFLSPLNSNPTKWSNTLKQFVGCCQQIVLSVFDHFMGLALKELIHCSKEFISGCHIANKNQFEGQSSYDVSHVDFNRTII